MKEREKCKRTSHYRLQCAKWFSRYPISKSGIWARLTSPFCRFSASFSLKYDVTDAIGLFHAAAMTTRERGQVRTNSSKMASNEMETPGLDDNKNLNNVQTPSPSVWSKRRHKVPNISFGWVEEFCKKTFDLPKKISPRLELFHQWIH